MLTALALPKTRPDLLRDERRLQPLAARPGDIIFTYSKGPFAWLTRHGQGLIRWVSSRERRTVRYSHVAMATEPGLLIHAAPGRMRHEPIADVLPRVLGRDAARIVRLEDEHLDAEFPRSIVKEASFFLNQRYSFGFGGRSTLVGRLMRRLGGEGRPTMPFCSQVVASAYAKAGAPLDDRPPDQTLPTDLDELCQPPRWKDVTDEYYPPPFESGLLSQATAARMEAMFEDLFDERPAERDVAAIGATVRNYSHITLASVNQMLDLFGPLLAFARQAAMAAASRPILLMTEGGKIVAADIQALPEFYERIARLPSSLEGDSAARLAEMFPDHGLNQEIFEGQRSIEQIAAQEFANNFLEFGSRALRLYAAMRAMGSALGLIPNHDSASDVPLETALSVFRALPDLSRPRAEELLQALAAFAEGRGADDPVAMGAAQAVINGHLMLSEVRASPQWTDMMEKVEAGS